MSYNGDIRTWFAENPHKVENIVNGNYENFKTLYKSVISSCPYVHPVGSKPGFYTQVVVLE